MGNVDVGNLFIPIVAFTFIGGALAYIFIKSKKFTKQLQEYASKHNLTYWSGDSSDKNLHSVVFDSYRRTMIQHALLYPDGAIIGEAAEGGKNGLLYVFASTPLNKYPNLRLTIDSTQNNPLGSSILERAIQFGKYAKRPESQLTHLELEGDFKDSYRIHIGHNQQIDALSLLNPATMAKLVDYFDKYDIEVYNGRIFFYIHATSEFHSSETFRENLVSNLRNFAEMVN